MRRWLWLLALCAAPAWAQESCPHASEVGQSHMLGLWRAELQGSGHAGTLLLEKHPHYAESFRGTINRNGERRAVAGDVEDGEFTLEESADGKRISATWIGEVVEGSCGREVRGTWTIDGEQTGRPFILRKQ
ncbi:hypothetical protein [Ramlibacter montanisoli]|uniref:DUF2147 domain-containing protein n=1 Tax=Ramlibacter montanisoli TaxID=2732512 RepID=A0A849KKY1_9BURK|nr:hypothetical protein [Ramlibacter montanisoli]NNU45111.1 hypothetical protein [Ramlibacter montanisoli]